MTNSLVAPVDLDDFPGAPFSDPVVDAAVGELRRAAGWHIAPSVSETLTVDSDGGRTLILPTLYLTAVDAVRNVGSDDPVLVDPIRFSRVGVVQTPYTCIPCGLSSVEVDVTHGYEECPPELLPIIAAACRQIGADTRTVTSQGAGPFSITYRDPSTNGGSVDPAVARYALPPRP